MRDSVLCSKIKFEKKSEENERLISELNEMKKHSDRLEQENQKFKVQLENERKKVSDMLEFHIQQPFLFSSGGRMYKSEKFHRYGFTKFPRENTFTTL